MTPEEQKLHDMLVQRAGDLHEIASRLKREADEIAKKALERMKAKEVSK